MQHLAGRPAGELLDCFGLSRKDVLLMDEPPGQLKGIAFKVDEGSTRKWITAIVEQTEALNDPKRDWSEQVIRNATVLQIFEGSRLF